jgi:hypothetical protein
VDFFPWAVFPVWAQCALFCVWAVCVGGVCVSRVELGRQREPISRARGARPIAMVRGAGLVGVGLAKRVDFLPPPKRFGGRGKSTSLASTDDSVGESVKVVDRQKHVFAREIASLRRCGHRDGRLQPV